MVDIAGAVDLLSTHTTTHAQMIGVIGFSLGAYYALKISVEDPSRVRSVVLFYGTGSEDFSTANAAYQGHFAEDDPYEPPEYVDQLESAIKAASQPVEFFRYQGVSHWFFERDRAKAYNEAAAKLAWNRSLAFLRETLFSNADDSTTFP
jgi:carboxymethylenebutenolidase